MSTTSPSAIARILDTPYLERVVPYLQPKLLHRVIERCGLADCAEIVSLATSAQLSEIFDLDLWRASRPGLDETLDADRFGEWLEVLVDGGASLAAEKLAGVSADLVSTGLAQYVRVFELVATTPYTTLDGEEVAPIPGQLEELALEIAGFRVVPRRHETWDAIGELLVALSESHPHYYSNLMGRCVEMSYEGGETDELDHLLDARDQAAFDSGSAREIRRDAQGYVSAADARAFLDMARSIRLDAAIVPPPNPLAAAYFRTLHNGEPARPATSVESNIPQLHAAPDSESAQDIAAMVELLREEGIVTEPPRALLSPADRTDEHLVRLHTLLRYASEFDDTAFLGLTEELGFLANAIVAGCSIHGRAFTEQEASDAVVAVCNLGLENWPPAWRACASTRDAGADPPDDFLVRHSLVTVFQVGWSVLHREVVMHTAEQLVEALARVRCHDLDIQRELDSLRKHLTKCCSAGTPWRAQDALEVIASLDPLVWTALAALTGEYPVLHKAIRATAGSGVRRVAPSDVEFISENRQIAAIHDYLRTLPELLAG